MEKRIIIIDDYNLNNAGMKTDGASSKTENVFKYFYKKYGNQYLVKRIFLKSWKKRPFYNLFSLVKNIRKSDIVILLPNDIRLKIYSLIFKRKIKRMAFIYMVVGGWLPEFLTNNKKVAAFCKNFVGIFPETKSMVDNLRKFGLNNVYYSPVFSLQSHPIEKDNYEFSDKKIDVCTFSRIDEEKGIFDAILAVKLANEKIGTKVYHLNIFGKINNETNEKRTYYLDFFKKNEGHCTYCGPVRSEELVNTLNKHFLLLFPTYFWGEGFPATLLESFCSGLPALASDWKYNNELVSNGKTGFLFETRSIEQISNLLIWCFNNSDKVLKMRQNCLNVAKLLNPDYCMKHVCNIIDAYLKRDSK